MDQPQPKLIVFECPHIRIFSIVENLAADRLGPEHYTRMRQTTVEQHVELYQAIESGVADDLRRREAAALVAEHEDVAAHDVHVGVALEVVYLCLDPLRNADVIRVHARDEICLHLKRNLHPPVECLSNATVLVEGEDADLARVHLLSRLEVLNSARIR